VRLTRLYVRFFRSFNFDYERKAHPESKPKPWELLDGAWFPFVGVELDHRVTAIVGANESGKSHLIDAVKQALTGNNVKRLDFCRYSTIFSVEAGHNRVPDVGIELELADDDDVELVAEPNPQAQVGDRVTLLRMGDGANLLIDARGGQIEMNDEQLRKLESGLPAPFELATDIALPDTISFDGLLDRSAERAVPRRRRSEIIDFFRRLPDVSQEAITNSAGELTGILVHTVPGDGAHAELTGAQLGRELLLKVAKIDKSAIEDLENALLDGKEGQVGGLVKQMNNALARHLNFNRWWTQDPDFQLRVEARERELVFTIRDRTGTDYSFDERSRGLKYFLSYFIQLRAHMQSPTGREVLLMDEPDAYLSSVGQQDLLRTLEAFAERDGELAGDQVVYVTHSPFLINRNAAHRIRVLDKGSNEEGTRVVRDVARNHYEPLRSALGAYVAETVFVGGTNLLVEGVSDQVLLAGASSLLLHRGGAPLRLLDLNQVTIVPAGSAEAIPYMAYLARGRDEIKPACVALLDGDRAGRDAAQRLARASDGRGKAILEESYVVILSDWAKDTTLELSDGVKLHTIEDLVPPAIAAEAARGYAAHLLGSTPEQMGELTAALISEKLSGPGKGSVWRAVQLAFEHSLAGAHIEKVGFAKEVIRHLEHVDAGSAPVAGLPEFEHNFGALLAVLAARLGRAETEEVEKRSHRRSDRIAGAFLRDFPDAASRDEADAFLRELEGSLELSKGDDRVRLELVALRRDFALGTDPLTPVPDYGDFRERVGELRALRRIAYRDEPPQEDETEARPEPDAPPRPPEAVETSTPVEAPPEPSS
jgi:predicted ATPase